MTPIDDTFLSLSRLPSQRGGGSPGAPSKGMRLMLKSRALGYGTDKTSLFSATPLIDQGRFSGLKPSLVLFPFTISLIMNEPPNMGLSEGT